MPILDQMNVKANESDTQGTDYDIRDRKLTTATSQSGVNTSDVVLLKDTSGNYHEITKDSFMGAVRSALGSLIKNYDKGTNVNGIAVTGSTGTVNDLGFSSPSDLASVLGGINAKGNFPTTSSADDITSPSIYSLTRGLTQGAPVEDGHIITIPNTSGYHIFLQICVASTGDKMWTRSKTANKNYTDWKDVSYSIPSFYKNYSDLSSLATAMGAIADNGDTVLSDFNNAKTGYYKVSYTTGDNRPISGYGILVHFEHTYAVQMYYPINITYGIWSRTRDYSGSSWTDWKRIDNFGCNTAADLASLLGDAVSYSGALDDLKKSGIFNCTAASGNPFGTNSTCIIVCTYVNSNLIMQRAYRNNDIKMRWLWDSTQQGSWTEWKTITLT